MIELMIYFDLITVTVSEGDDYEKEFWPVAVGLYFTSQQWRESKKRGCNPALVHPNFFVRSSDYWESLVETAANEFGESCMKVEDAECLDQRDFCYIVNVVKDVIKKYNAAMCKEKMEFDPDDECDIKPKIYCVESSTTSSPESEERSSTSSESSPTRVEEPREVAKVDSPESSDSDSDSLEDYDPALERTILDEFDVPKIKVTVRRKVDAFYQHPGEVYSHYIPDKAGVETEFRTGIRRHHVADILDMKPVTEFRLVTCLIARIENFKNFLSKLCRGRKTRLRSPASFFSRTRRNRIIHAQYATILSSPMTVKKIQVVMTSFWMRRPMSKRH